MACSHWNTLPRPSSGLFLDNHPVLFIGWWVLLDLEIYSDTANTINYDWQHRSWRALPPDLSKKQEAMGGVRRCPYIHPFPAEVPCPHWPRSELCTSYETTRVLVSGGKIGHWLRRMNSSRRRKCNKSATGGSPCTRLIALRWRLARARFTDTIDRDLNIFKKTGLLKKWCSQANLR